MQFLLFDKLIIFACEKKNSMTKPFLLFPSFGCNHYGKCEISPILRG